MGDFVNFHNCSYFRVSGIFGLCTRPAGTQVFNTFIDPQLSRTGITTLRARVSQARICAFALNCFARIVSQKKPGAWFYRSDPVSQCFTNEAFSKLPRQRPRVFARIRAFRAKYANSFAQISHPSVTGQSAATSR